MKKALIYILAVIGGLSAVIALTFTAVQAVVFDESRFHRAYEEYEIYDYIGIEKQDLDDVTHNLLEYMKGNREDIIMYADIKGEQQMVFEEREQLHMVDVLRLFDAGFTIRNICAISAAAIFILILLLYKKSGGRIIARGYLIGFSIFFVLLIALGIAMVVDFSTLFTKFHLLLFDNDLWLLDPKEDIMIQMFPEEFFNGLGIWIGIYAVVFISVPAMISSVYLSIKKKRPS
ncbi:MAG: TIGR01906 family membrane protein [Clostridia bacterium]|nr:TIGR01906 family membrane protein [Clostridia bacterium]